MTSASDKVGLTAAMPVLPLSVAPSLAYSTLPDRTPPMIRVGGLIGCLCFVFISVYWSEWSSSLVSSSGIGSIYLLIPVMQLIGAGCGITLILMGRRFANRRVGSAFKLALTVNLLSIVGACAELGSTLPSSSPRSVYRQLPADI